jgi:tetratricopeptide (TPR) repeat protein
MKQYLVLSFLALMFMQDVRLAEVSGEIRDMRGKPIAGANVVYTHVDNGKTYRFKTDENGQYHVIGLMLGHYNLVVTGPSGKRIYSGKKLLSAGNAQKINMTQIDLSIVPAKASLAPFKGARADELKNAREKAYAEGKQLSPAELAEVRNDNLLIARYNELTPDAQSAIKDQDWKRAAELLKQLVAIAPYKWELYQNLGTIQRNLRQYEEAVTLFEQGLQVLREDQAGKPDHGKNAFVAMMRIGEGEALAALDRLEDASAQFRAAAELDPRPAMAYLHLCATEYNNGHGDAALAACSHAIAAEPEHTEGYQVLATVESNLDRQQDAVRTYEKGISIAVGNMRASRPSMKSNINSQHLADPFKAIREAVRAGQMMQSLGNIYFQLKNYRKAAELFSQAATLHPYPALPLFNLCATLYDMNNFGSAAAACDRAIEADPKAPDAYFVKASALYGEAAKKGRVKASHEAISALEKYLQLAPEGFYSGDARSMLKEMGSGN